MTYHRIPIQKAVLYLSSTEIQRLLQKDPILFREALRRGKAFGRCESKSAQYAKKLANHESDALNKFLE